MNNINTLFDKKKKIVKDSFAFYLAKNGKYKNNLFHADYLNLLSVLFEYIYWKDIYIPPVFLKESKENFDNLILVSEYIAKGEEKMMYYEFDDGKKIFFLDKHKEYVIYRLFMRYITDVNREAKKFFTGTLEKRLIRSYLITRLSYKKESKDIFISIFYNIYIKDAEIQDELKRKYNISLSDFENYHKLYLFLKKEGYVELYYKKYVPLMIKNYKKYLKKLLGYKSYNRVRDVLINNFKPFSENIVMEIKKKIMELK